MYIVYINTLLGIHFNFNFLFVNFVTIRFLYILGYKNKLKLKDTCSKG